MPVASDPDFRVLHGLRLRRVAPAPTLGLMLGPGPWDPLDDRLRDLGAAGYLKERLGRVAGWTMTADGRARHEALLADDRAASPLEEVASAYELFMTVNQSLIDLCTDWQVRADTGDVNDHSDASYDRGVVERLVRVHTVGQDVCTRLASAAGRFDRYGGRLERAVGSVEQGQGEWLTGAFIDSYHTIWFELHEDLLLTLGLERGAHR